MRQLLGLGHHRRPAPRTGRKRFCPQRHLRFGNPGRKWLGDNWWRRLWQRGRHFRNGWRDRLRNDPMAQARKRRLSTVAHRITPSISKWSAITGFSPDNLLATSLLTLFNQAGTASLVPAALGGGSAIGACSIFPSSSIFT